MSDETGTGATPGSGATPGQPTNTSPGATPAAQPANPSSTGEEALGEAGRKILHDARIAVKAAEDRAKAAERERDDLRTATQSESERAVARARKDGATEVAARYQAQLRRSGVKTALVAAGVNPELLDLVTKDDAFADLEVVSDHEAPDFGDVKGVDAAVAALKKARPSLFAKGGDFGGGNRGTTPPTPPSTNELLRAVLRG